MIKLTAYEDDKPFYLNPDLIVAVYEEISSTTIDYSGERYSVEESPEEVVRKIMRYRRYTETHRAAVIELDSKHEKECFDLLRSLAGLESDSK